ncbi:hypothetical protein [Streptosporangium sp. KLBMP 9127]|nr:hypothetical protein [Streptosporangium sp. KLBMP 9127]
MITVATGRSALGPPVRRLLFALAAAAAGLLLSALFDLHALTDSSAYIAGVTLLLAVGLYGSAAGIPADAVRDVRRVVVAVTIGVLLKAALIAAVMFLFYPGPASLILGVAVAQIDPLSVAAMMAHSHMSRRAKGLLLAWASFDDPITALLTIYLSVFALTGPGDGASVVRLEPSLGPYLAGLGLNLLFALGAWLLWQALNRLPISRTLFQVLAVTGLVGLGALAVWQFLMLGVALLGLFYRPALGRIMDGLITVAFYLAAVALGVLLMGGVQLAAGVVLGVAAFAAQVVVGGLLIAPRRAGITDRVYLALGQQNGITAILLALSLQPVFPEAIQIVAPAILVINVLHIVTNAVWDRRAALPRLLSSVGTSPERPALGKVAQVSGVADIARRSSKRLEAALEKEAGGSPEW